MSDENETDRSPRPEEVAGNDAEPNRIPGVPSELSDVDRRRVLGAIGGAGTVSLAGCIGLFDEPETGGVDGDDGDDGDGDDDDDEENGDGDADAFDIEFLEQAETIQVASDQNLLEAGEDEGWELPYQCRSGVCGVCEAEVDGDGHDLVEMTNNDVLSDDEIEEGAVLTCTGQPRDEFAIDTHPE